MSVPHTDELGELIVAKGLAANEFLLNLNGFLSWPEWSEAKAPWNLPSPMFRSPIITTEPQGSRPRQLGLRHPALANHPWVKEVEALLGLEISRDPLLAGNGYPVGRDSEYGHAVDLITAGHWRELIETAGFTSCRAIFSALEYGLRYSDRREEAKGRNGYLSCDEARQIMAFVGSSEPVDCRSLMLDFVTPALTSCSGSRPYYPVNGGPRSHEHRVWGFIWAIENGWFAYDRSGHLEWSEVGVDRYAAGAADTYTESSGQSAFAF